MSGEKIRCAISYPFVAVCGNKEFPDGWKSIRWRCAGEARPVFMTRSRPNKKDDNAHVEEKNWTHFRHA